MNVGGKPVVTEKGLLSTVLFKLGKDKDVVYGFEGAVECGASTINWLKNSLSLYSTFDEMTELAKSVSDKENVFFIPAFSGLFSPYWSTKVSGSIFGLTQFSKKSNIIRATIEGICFRNKDVIECMKEVSGKDISKMRVDGGVTSNKWIMQLQSNILGV